MTRRWILEALPTTSFAGVVLLGLAATWWARLWYPFDLEWMEGGMLAHAWRLDQGLQIYVHPDVDFVPYIYPPGYPLVLAALGKLFGLSMPLGRAVSLLSIALAAGALGYRLWRVGGGALALASSVVFLGTWPQSGAFYDLVRSDSLGMALLGWSIVLGLERGPRAKVASGLLLAAAFLVKQNAAAFGVPMLLGIWLCSRREALIFASSSILPALLGALVLQVWSSGAFSIWMLEVASAHPMTWSRAWTETPREWGSALPIAWLLLTLAALLESMARQRSLPHWLLAILPLWSGILCAWWGTWPMNANPAGRLGVLAAGAGYLGMVALPLSLGLLLVGVALDARRDRTPLGWPSWERLYEDGVLATAAGTALLMRVHDSGFVNVHTPLFFCLALAFATRLARWQLLSPTPLVRGVVALALILQLGWSLRELSRQRAQLVPTEADVQMGWRFVAAISQVDGPVLSPFAAWLPVYAGKPPSLHAMGVWDCLFEGSPYRKDLQGIERAMADHHWAAVLAGPDALLGNIGKSYVPSEILLQSDDPTFMPKTGYLTRPMRILVPR